MALALAGCADIPNCGTFPKNTTDLSYKLYHESQLIEVSPRALAALRIINACYRSGDYPRDFGILEFVQARIRPNGNTYLVFSPIGVTDYQMIYEVSGGTVVNVHHYAPWRVD